MAGARRSKRKTVEGSATLRLTEGDEDIRLMVEVLREWDSSPLANAVRGAYPARSEEVDFSTIYREALREGLQALLVRRVIRAPLEREGVLWDQEVVRDVLAEAALSFMQRSLRDGRLPTGADERGFVPEAEEWTWVRWHAVAKQWIAAMHAATLVVTAEHPVFDEAATRRWSGKPK